jgi:hypothetical protein
MPDVLRRRFPLIFFVLFYLLLTNWTYKDFGETFDESGVYTRGIVLQHYMIHDDFFGFLHKSAPDDGAVIYNHFYSLVLSALNPSGDLDNYHWLNMVFALLAFIALFELLLSQTQKPALAILGPLFLFLTPRFSGDIPANPKDMPFAVFYLLSLSTIYLFHQKPQTHPSLKVLTLGLLFGGTQSCRLLGLTLYPVFVLFDLHFFYHRAKHTISQWKNHLFEVVLALALVFMVSNFLMILTWPYLGANYFNHFSELLGVAKNFSWNNTVLFMGKEILSTQLPWSYLPVWFLVTTPLFILFFLAASFFVIQNKNTNPLLILMGTAVAVNGIIYWVLEPVLYDGLRHFMFLLPILAVIAALSAAEWFERSKRGLVFKIILGLCLLNGFTVAYHLVRLHPYEYIYFNEFTGGLKGSQGNFDNDYWGASFKEAVDWLEKNEMKDPNKIVKVSGSGNPYQIFYYFTPNLKWVDNPQDADYYLSYTRDNKQTLVDPFKVIHVIQREGVPLNYIFKLK